MASTISGNLVREAFAPKGIAQPSSAKIPGTPDSNQGIPGPAGGAVATLSPEARAAQVEEAQARWDRSIQAGLQNPDSAPEVKEVLKAAIDRTEAQAAAAQAAGQGFDKDAALAGNLAEMSLVRSEALKDGPGKSSLLSIFDTSVGYVQARHAQITDK